MTDTVNNVLQDDELENVSGGGGDTGPLGTEEKYCEYCKAKKIHYIYFGGREICSNSANHKK